MTKNYAKFVPAKSRTSRRKNWRASLLVAVFLGVTALVALGSFLYMNRSHGGVDNQNIASWVAKVTALIYPKKTNMAVTPAPPITKTALAASDEQAPPVRFDFYDELPNMQMSPDGNQSNAENTSAPTSPDASVPPAPAASPLPTEAPAVAAAQPVAPQTVAATTAPTAAAVAVKPAVAPIFNPDEISNLLAAERNVPHAGQRYFVHIGVFQTEQAANRLREAIAAVGFEAVVVKVKQGSRKVYHVQQGPYESVALAKESQQRLEKRGITSSIQKESA